MKNFHEYIWNLNAGTLIFISSENLQESLRRLQRMDVDFHSIRRTSRNFFGNFNAGTLIFISSDDWNNNASFQNVVKKLGDFYAWELLLTAGVSRWGDFHQTREANTKVETAAHITFFALDTPIEEGVARIHLSAFATVWWRLNQLAPLEVR